MQAADGASLEFELPDHFIFAYLLGDDISSREEAIKDVMAKTGIKSIILVQADNEEDIESFAVGQVY